MSNTHGPINKWVHVLDLFHAKEHVFEIIAGRCPKAE
jgi:hypothetical protein